MALNNNPRKINFADGRGFKFLFFVLLCSMMLLMMGGVGLAFQPGCSTTYTDYIVIDEFNDTDTTNLVSHPPTGGSKNNDTAGYYNYGGATNTQTILNNEHKSAGNDDYKGLRFKDIGNTNITLEYDMMVGSGSDTNLYISIHEGGVSFSGCLMGSLSATSLRYFNGGTPVDTTVSFANWSRVKVTGDQTGNCWFYFYNSTGALTISSGKVAKFGGTGVINAMDFRSQSSLIGRGDNLTIYEGNTCPQAAPPDTSPPSWSKNNTNISTPWYVNNKIGFNVTWTDETALSTAILGFDEGDGTWKNVTTKSISGTSADVSFGWTFNRSGNIQWQFFGTDSSGNGNKSDIFTYVVNNTNPTWSNNVTNFTSVKYGDIGLFNITLSDDVTLSTVIFEYDNGTGILKNISSGLPTNPITVNNSFKIGNATGYLIKWRWYFNDSSNNWNQTPLWTFNISNTIPSISNVLPSASTYRDSLNLTANFTIADADLEIDSRQKLQCYLWVDNVVNQSYNCGIGTAVLNATGMINGSSYQWFVEVADRNGHAIGYDDVNSTAKTFIVDTESPYIKAYNTISITGSSIFSNKLTNFTITDIAYDSGALYRVALTIENSTRYAFFNFSHYGISGTTFAWNNLTDLNLLSIDGMYWFVYNLSDSHTNKKIPEYDTYTNLDTGKLRYVTEHNNDISITPVGQIIGVNTAKKFDRYSFYWKYNQAGQHSYIVESTNSIEYLSQSSYPGHMIIAKGTTGNWLDFSCVNTNLENVEKVSDYKYIVTLVSQDKEVYCNSLGGLNERDETQNFTMDSTIPSLYNVLPSSGLNSSKSLVSLNATIVDEHPSYCWIRHNQTGTFAINNTQTYVNNTVCNFNITFPDGKYIYGILANDTAGNINWTANQTITIDTTPPSVTLITPLNISVWDAPSLNISMLFNATDATGILNCSLMFELAENSSKTTLINNEANFSLLLYNRTNLYRWGGRCYDALGNSFTTDYRVFNISNYAPILSSFEETVGQTSYLGNWTFTEGVNITINGTIINILDSNYFTTYSFNVSNLTCATNYSYGENRFSDNYSNAIVEMRYFQTLACTPSTGGGGGGGGGGGWNKLVTLPQTAEQKVEKYFESDYLNQVTANLKQMPVDLINWVEKKYDIVVDFFASPIKPIAVIQGTELTQEQVIAKNQDEQNKKVFVGSIVAIVAIAALIALWLSGGLGMLFSFAYNWISNIISIFSTLAAMSLFNLVLFMIAIVLILIILMVTNVLKIF